MADRPGNQQSALVELRFGNQVAMKAEAHLTPSGLLAIGALVSSILLSVAPIIWSARRRPY
ncbi:hypothetical protein [Roseomonas xinghualingensis]|uniref:hypothetical protein n=1 Tax=Roseomonas xinghualingensis TaxID=2986475 RepID=UPI0021F0AD4C|nr:hypothetical protein [Roseomonas sp. SXEYE001]MCV4206083.1 hypothetical protein [Roseomonas sp. SXEYE001]